VSGFLKSFTFIIPMTLEIFLPCYFGNELSMASSKLSNAFFHSEWMNEDKQFRIISKTFLESLKNEIKISAFRVFEVNLATFTRIGNSAYSLFAILKRVNN
jgi:odorant receptor